MAGPITGDSTLRDVQAYVKAIESARGFAHETSIEKCLLLGEEVGELFKAVRLRSGLATDSSSLKHEVAHEIADVLAFLVAIANRFEIDLGAALGEKELINAERVWNRELK